MVGAFIVIIVSGGDDDEDDDDDGDDDDDDDDDGGEHTCLFITFSTVERFRGADVEFSISFVSCPEYTAIPV